MRAFLSHSSKDKVFVESVAAGLRAGTYELDSATFEYGALNGAAISSTLARCNIFVVFVSKNSINSPFVAFEVALAQELYANGKMHKLLFFCTDESSFNEIDERWKSFNIVRRVYSSKAVSRQILSALVEDGARESANSHLFVGRSEEIDEIKDRIIDPEKAPPKALLVSGNQGVGRRTFMRNVFQRTFPEVQRLIPEFPISQIDGYDEIYRKLVDHYEVDKPLVALAKQFEAFAARSDEDKAQAIADIITKAQHAREAIIFRDDGGILLENGGIRPPIAAPIARLSPLPFPALILVTERTPPINERRLLPEVAIQPLKSLPSPEMRQLIGLQLRSISVEYSNEDLASFVELSDGHPFNARFIVENVKAYGVKPVIANPNDLITWKNRRTAEYLNSLTFTDEEKYVLGLLRQFPSLEFGILASSSRFEETKIADAVSTLIDKHIVEVSSGIYYVAPPLRGSVERNKIFDLSQVDLKAALSSIATNFRSVDDGPVSVSFVDSGVLAALQSDTELHPQFSAFLLPSHLLWLARRRYDSRKFDESLRLSTEALKSLGRLSLEGKNEAGRLHCLAAARLDDEAAFQFGLQILRGLPSEPWIVSNLEFLQGFLARLNGQLPKAEAHQREAIRLRPASFAAARELASICLVRGNFSDAEKFARQAYEIAPDNPFVIDVLTSALISAYRAGKQSALVEVERLLAKLDHVGRDGNRSFFETRSAEYYLALGRVHDAEKWINKAVLKTANIFDVQAIKAKIALSKGSISTAADAIKIMERLVRRTNQQDGRRHLRNFFDIKRDYLIEVDRFDDARKQVEVQGVYADDERVAELKLIDNAEAYRRSRGA